jgi:hypothetical protein
MDSPVQDFQIPLSFPSLGLNMEGDKEWQMEGMGERKRNEILIFWWVCSKQNQARCKVPIMMVIKSFVFYVLRHAVWQNFTDILEKRASAILRIEEKAKQEIRENRAFLARIYCLHFQGWKVNKARNQRYKSSFLLVFLFDLHDDSSTFRRNVGTLLLKYTALHPRRH